MRKMRFFILPAAIRANYEALFAASSLEISHEITEVFVHADMAYITGSNRVTLRPKGDPDGAVEVQEDTFVAVYFKIEGHWLLHVLMWK